MSWGQFITVQHCSATREAIDLATSGVAIEIVMEAYARGEITDKEYESMCCTLGDR
jgi:uncharacterized membrane protein